jgi:AraC-like DNA-binding protein
MNGGVGKARGVLRPAPDAPSTGLFHHARIAPPPALAGVVQHYWIVRWDLQGGPPQLRETLPHPNVHLACEAAGNRIHGIHTGRFSTVLEGCGGVFGVKFRPGGFHGFLRQPVSVLRNRSIAPEQVFGTVAAELATIMQASPDDEHMVSLASDFLVTRLPPPDAQALRVGEMVDAIAIDRSLRTLDDLATCWSITPRTLQRLFNQYVGIGPKWVINRYRMHEALERVDAGKPMDWTQLALDLGYFDQAHFIRDFKALVGCSPVGYARRGQSG